MSIDEIKKEVASLSEAEQGEVAAFLFHLRHVRDGEGRALSPEELGHLAQRMAETPDAAEADRLEQEIVRGFYGRKSNA